MANRITHTYSAKAGDIFDGQPSDVDEARLVNDIIKGQLEQESGDPNEYGYAGAEGIYHYYWAIVDGGWNVMRRKADARHPANGPWDPWKDPPAGVEPPDRGGLDPFNW